MIFWDLILKTEDICEELERMYSQMSLQGLATHLGVSKDALRKKLVECKILVRGRGGSYPRISRDDLPTDAHKLDVAQLAALTGYTEQYCRKLRRQLRSKHGKTRNTSKTKKEGGMDKPLKGP